MNIDSVKVGDQLLRIVGIVHTRYSIVTVKRLTKTQVVTENADGVEERWSKRRGMAIGGGAWVRKFRDGETPESVMAKQAEADALAKERKAQAAMARQAKIDELVKKYPKAHKVGERRDLSHFEMECWDGVKLVTFLKTLGTKWDGTDEDVLTATYIQVSERYGASTGSVTVREAPEKAWGELLYALAD